MKLDPLETQFKGLFEDIITLKIQIQVEHGK